jgi:uncharacterized membrane protein (TIGR02234 family)
VTPRHELVAAVLAAAAAGALALLVSGQVWARVTAEGRPPLPPVTGELTGGGAAPLVPACGLVLLAAAVALVAVRRLGRAAVGLLAVLAGGALGWAGLRALTGGLQDASTEVPGVGRVPGPVTVDVAAAWPVLAVLAGVVGVLAGVFVVVRGRGWPEMGRRYERGAGPASPSAEAREVSDEERAAAAWRALDRGDDPTEDRPPPPPGSTRS